MVVLKGPVRFRFRRPEDDVDVLVQGEASWVQSVRENLGLSAVGWVQPLAVTGSSSTNEPLLQDNLRCFTTEKSFWGVELSFLK